MRVRVNENIKLFQGHVPVRLAEGQEVTGELAALLLKSAPGKVTCLDAPEESESGQTPGHREPCVDGDVCDGPHCPPESDPDADATDPGDPPPSDELDITAAVGKVLDWVGDDPERAEQAAAAEQATDKPRATLLKQLAKLTES
ncbi:hypothetical protein PV413_03220 [Streptomyces scabiei]|uniref:hypothetical protein n=1 Tax=Streptomyces scabiei TaxID=1930 RepID=UPI0002D25B29|nr:MULTISPECIES: hypothetical protein [Streptomyces]MBP5875662.1 hypothetical protein [Streptomyces sp. LBUM 1477]MDX2652116.1 hypothetical protein [Streptomyces scabiei]MDX2725858.1 hypothetical protein [Streptomyces scabiei]MDX2749648.1 hypothetical protein [Streptomyces scabiei]MDX2863977.1 hypothetical protein [Streptomyces scabiei]